MLKITEKVKPLVLCILDGWAIAANGPGNAITRAHPRNFNDLWFSYPHTYLPTAGQAVGLPEGLVGNSEVGHLNLGAGKVIFQDVLKINLAIQNGSFFENEALLAAINHATRNDSNIHVMGLVGLGQVHSNTNHLLTTLALIKEEGFPASKVKIHFITDGRDSPPTSAKTYLAEIESKIRSENLGQISSIGGRYFAMDRDNRWDRTQLAYQALLGQSESRAYDPISALEISYTEGITDEFVKPTVVCDKEGKPTGPISKNDSVIFFNFRPDRARQLTRAFVDNDFKKVKTPSGQTISTFDRGPKLENLFFVTFTSYEAGLPVSAVVFKKEEVPMPIARVFSERNLRQFHIAETEKYAHVTYFFNGGREAPFPGEDRLLVNSPKVASYDLKPEMSTPEVAKQIIRRINSRFYDFIVVNLANADMVGHTGNFEATCLAVQAADNYLGTITKSALAKGGGILITADHGNAEQMINPQTKQKDTEHNGNPAPMIICINELRGNNVQLSQGLLADVAPTILGILGIPKPSQMTGRNLLQ
ncbi:2,3-bisphosphoglycerate-independent phosphoglycerate mutase [Candidatus Curtissbacteria bacterium]|nr:2,3-bisphosphoglycerate-independent phosphoglycerate mutase [Candidatus Curtissbacteria bacterium]